MTNSTNKTLLRVERGDELSKLTN